MGSLSSVLNFYQVWVLLAFTTEPSTFRFITKYQFGLLKLVS